MRKSNVVANYLFILSIILIGIVLITYVLGIYKKGKETKEYLGEMDVKELSSSYYLIESPEGYKVRIKKELLVSNLQDLKFVLKDEEGNIICTCYYNKKINNLNCDNCTVE